MRDVYKRQGLRGAAADEDARFAEGFCADLGIPCIVKHYDVRAEAKARGLGEEEMGRLLRYAASVSYTHLDVYKRQVQRSHGHCRGIGQKAV